MHPFPKFLSFMLLACFAACATLSAQDLEDVLNRYYEAMGGKEQLGSIKTLKIKGQVNYKGTKFPFLILVKDNKARMEYHLEGGSVIRVFDGQKGWEINTMVHNSKPQPLTCHDSAYMKELAEGTCPLYEWKEKGHQVVLKGTVEEDGKQLIKLDLKSKHGQEMLYFLDAESMKPVFAKRIEGQGQDYKIEFKGFHRIANGLLFPEKIQIGEKYITYTEQSVNVEIDDRLFKAEGAMPQLAP